MKTLITAALSLLTLASAAGAQTFSVTAGVTPVNGLYNYDYLFSLTGLVSAGASVSNLYLTSGDLSPLGPFTFAKDGAAAPSWTFTSNDTPYNYLQFYSASDSLTNGDTMEVKFTSAYAPSATGSATGLDDSTGNFTNTVTGLAAPVPEMNTAPLLALGALWLGFAAYRRRRA